MSDSELAPALDTSDFDSWNLEPQVLGWLESHCAKGAKILELGSGKSTRELSRFFKVIAIEEAADRCIYEKAQYVVAPFTNGWYHEHTIAPFLAEAFDAIIVDGPYAASAGRTAARLGFVRYVSRLKGTPHIIVDDLQRPFDFANFWIIWWHKRTKVEFFVAKGKYCAVISGTSHATMGNFIANIPIVCQLSASCLKLLFKNFSLYFKDGMEMFRGNRNR